MRVSSKSLAKLALDVGATARVGGRVINASRRDRSDPFDEVESSEVVSVPPKDNPALERLKAAEARLASLSGAYGELQNLLKSVIDDGKASAELTTRAIESAVSAARTAAEAPPIVIPVQQQRKAKNWTFKPVRDVLGNLDAIIATSELGDRWRFDMKRGEDGFSSMSATKLEH